MLNKITYTSPILFTLKLNGEWWFCVDYWKLNRITEKNKYLLPLINKIFRRITKAKVFIKLNIRYIFHCIYIHLDSKVLTAFGMCYEAYCNGPRPESYSRPPAGIYPWLEPPSFLVNSGQS